MVSLLLGSCGGTDGPAKPAGDDGGTPPPEAGPGVADVPCEVSQLISKYCLVCHTSPPIGGATMPLVGRVSLLIKAPSVESNVAIRALALMRDTTLPMPPEGLPRPTADEIAAFEKWITDGYPDGTCAGGLGDPYDTPVMCSSGVYGTEDEGYDMRPGELCVTCHLNGEDGEEPEGPIFNVAGTLYPTGHEPNNCFGWGGGGAVVEITDKNGVVYRPEIRPSGNFVVEDDAFTPPYSARVLYQGRVRAMTAMPSNRDCNSCHTQDGTGDPLAPGRIMLP